MNDTERTMFALLNEIERLKALNLAREFEVAIGRQAGDELAKELERYHRQRHGSMCLPKVCPVMIALAEWRETGEDRREGEEGAAL